MNPNSNLIEIKLIKLARNPKEKYVSPAYKLSIKNLDNFLSEKIIRQNIDFKDLFYKTSIYILDKLQNVIRSNFIPIYPVNQNIMQRDLFLMNKFVPGKQILITELTDNEERIPFDPINLYKLKVSLVYKIPNSQFENQFNTSNEILFNPKVGEVTQKYVDTMNREMFSKKKIFSKSEKDNIKYVKAATALSGLDIFWMKKILKNSHMKEGHMKILNNLSIVNIKRVNY